MMLDRTPELTWPSQLYGSLVSSESAADNLRSRSALVRPFADLFDRFDIQILTDRKYEELSPSTHNVDVPNVTRKEYQLINSELFRSSVRSSARDGS